MPATKEIRLEYVLFLHNQSQQILWSLHTGRISMPTLTIFAAENDRQRLDSRSGAPGN